MRKVLVTLLALVLVATGTVGYVTCRSYLDKKEAEERAVQNLIDYYDSIPAEYMIVNGNEVRVMSCPGFNDLEEAVPDVSIQTEEEAELEYIGEFKLTGYCNCEHCNGVWAWGPTASGEMPEEGRTVAVDSDIIPLGTHLMINGHEYIAEDTGSAIIGNRIDVYKEYHSECFSSDCNGYVEVYIIK